MLSEKKKKWATCIHYTTKENENFQITLTH